MGKLVDIWIRAIFARKSPEVRALGWLWIGVWVLWEINAVISAAAGVN